MQTKFPDAPQIIKEYLYYMLTIKGRSPRTVQAYYTDLALFFRYLYRIKNKSKSEFIQEIDISDLNIDFVRSVTLSDIYEYMNYVLSERSNNSTTRARKASTIRSYFRFLTTKANLLQDDPAKSLETPSIKKSLPKYLTLEESIELLASVDGTQFERNYCIMTLFLNCGLRLSELVGINLTDIKNNTLRVLGKGNKERQVYLNEACISAIDKYLLVRKDLTVKELHKNALFISKNGTRLGPRSVQLIVTKFLETAGLAGRGFSTHKLRHTAATLMYQHGNVDIRVLKDILGHESIATTEIYTHVSSGQMEKAMNAIPLSKVRSRRKEDK